MSTRRLGSANSACAPCGIVCGWQSTRAGLQLQVLGRVVLDHDVLETIQVRQCVAGRVLAPVGRVLLERRLLLGHVLVEHEGAGADRVLDDVALVAARQDGAVVVAPGHRVREVGVRLEEAELDRSGVDRLGTAWVEHAAPLGLGAARAAVGIEKALDGRDHVLGLEGAAVVEGDALAQLEGPHVERIVRRPALGELRLERVVVVQVDEELEELGDEHDAALVVDGDRVGIGDRRRADDAEDAAHDRSRHAGRARRRGGLRGAAAGGEQLTGGGEREAEHRRAHEQLAPRHLSLEDLVDQMLAVLSGELLASHIATPPGRMPVVRNGFRRWLGHRPPPTHSGHHTQGGDEWQEVLTGQLVARLAVSGADIRPRHAHDGISMPHRYQDRQICAAPWRQTAVHAGGSGDWYVPRRLWYASDGRSAMADRRFGSEIRRSIVCRG